MNHPISKKDAMAKKPTKLLVTRNTLYQHRALASLVDVPVQEVTDAHIRSHDSGLGIYAMLQPLMAMRDADKEGREYTPVFWHRTDDDVLHLTLWDMNTPNKIMAKAFEEVWSTPNSPTEW